MVFGLSLIFTIFSSFWKSRPQKLQRRKLNCLFTFLQRFLINGTQINIDVFETIVLNTFLSLLIISNKFTVLLQ